MNKRNLIKVLNKIRNVEYEDNKIVFDDISQKIYNNTLKEVSRLESTYNVNLDYLRNELKSQKINLQKAIRESNRNDNDNNSLIDVKRESDLLTRIEDTIHYLNPNRKSEPFKEDTVNTLKMTQKHNTDIAEFELKVWSDLTGLDEDVIESYLFPSGNEENAWYDIYTELVINGMTPDDAYVNATSEYERQKINGKKIYNMQDVIKNFVPKHKQVRASEFLKNMTKIRLLNMREV